MRQAPNAQVAFAVLGVLEARYERITLDVNKDGLFKIGEGLVAN